MTETLPNRKSPLYSDKFASGGQIQDLTEANVRQRIPENPILNAFPSLDPHRVAINEAGYQTVSVWDGFNQVFAGIQRAAAVMLLGTMKPLEEAVSTRSDLYAYSLIEACQHEQQQKKRVVRVQLKPMKFEWDEDIAAVDEALTEYNIKSNANH